MDLDLFGTSAAFMLVFAGAAWLRWRSPGTASRLTRSFARKVDLGMDDAVEDLVTARLARRERAGAVGGLIIGLAAAAVVATTTGPSPRDFNRLAAVFLSFLVGHALGYGVVAWRESVRRPVAGPRLARATAPTHGDYVARHERIGSWVTAGIAGVTGVGFLLADRADALDGAVPVGVAVAAVVVPPAAVLADELLARRLLARPQVAASQTELAWDDALRARTLRDMVTVPLVTGYIALTALVGGVGEGLEGGWPGNAAVGWVSGAFLVLLLAGLVMMVVSLAIGPERHFRRRLWPNVPTSPRSPLLDAVPEQGTGR